MTERDVPAVKPWFQEGFHRFLRPFLRRHFHAIAIDRSSLDPLPVGDQVPLLVYANHPSWWDPLVAHFLNRAVFPTRQFYAPIDASSLQHYAVMRKLGFYGVQLGTVGGAGAFLKKSLAIAQAGRTALWITPEGRFTDSRDHEPELMPGLAHLSLRLTHGHLIPLALEYVFWDDRLPNCLMRFGDPIRVTDLASCSKPECQRLLKQRLRQTQVDLAKLSTQRSSAPFVNLLAGKRGAGGFYDWARRLRAYASGTEYRAAHGDQFE